MMAKIGRVDTQPFVKTDHACTNKECWAYIGIDYGFKDKPISND